MAASVQSDGYIRTCVITDDRNGSDLGADIRAALNGSILNRLIAEKKAKPMIVVMPSGHTSRTFRFGGGGGVERMVDELHQELFQ